MSSSIALDTHPRTGCVDRELIGSLRFIFDRASTHTEFEYPQITVADIGCGFAGLLGWLFPSPACLWVLCGAVSCRELGRGGVPNCSSRKLLPWLCNAFSRSARFPNCQTPTLHL